MPSMKPKPAPEPQNQLPQPPGEPEEQQRPLHILHGILQDVAGRLALNEAVLWARGSIKEPGGTWAKLLRLNKATLLPVGVRYLLHQPNNYCALSLLSESNLCANF